MDKNDVISMLNDLIETSKDGEKGFRTCANGVKDAQLKALFNETAQRCAEGAAELQTKVRALGGDPEKRDSTSAALPRGWINIKSTITGMDEAAVLAECERGEDVAKRAYEAALKKDLPSDVRSIVERQYQGVKQNHDHVRDLRNARSWLTTKDSSQRFACWDKGEHPGMEAVEIVYWVAQPADAPRGDQAGCVVHVRGVMSFAPA